MKEYSFEKLEVWKDAQELALRVYKITSNFPIEERYGLTSQMRRAANSICSNLAEGVSRTSYKDQARFSEIAFGSLMELLSQALTANNLQFIISDELMELRIGIDSIGYKINRLREAQIKKIKPK